MLPTALRENQARENSGQKVHPQPINEPMNENPEALEAFLHKIFSNISSLKSAYIQLQAAHTPYDPEKIQSADKLVISHLKSLSELKHFYRENCPHPNTVPPQDSRFAAEIQEQQNLLATYEVMVKKFQSELQNKDSEIADLQCQIDKASQRREKLEKNLKLRGLPTNDYSSSSEKSDVANWGPHVKLSLDMFIAYVDAAYDSVHDFSRLLINMMKATRWDLDAAAESVAQSVVYAKRAHKKYAFESYTCHRMFPGFQQENFSDRVSENGYGPDPASHCPLQSLDQNGFTESRPESSSTRRERFFTQFLALKDSDPLDVLDQDPDSEFGVFCRSKYLFTVHPKMEASFFGNLDQRKFVNTGGHPRTKFYRSFLSLARSVWLLHRLAHSFEPAARIFQVKRGSKFSDNSMMGVAETRAPPETGLNRKVELMVMPGFWIEGTIVKSRVYLSCTSGAH